MNIAVIGSQWGDEGKGKLIDILSQESGSIVRLVRKRTQGIKPAEIRESLKRADIQIDFPPIPISSPSTNGRAQKTPRSAKSRKPVVTAVNIADLINKGLINPPLQLEAMYKGSNLTATIQADGTVRFGGKSYNSLSTAAGMARASLRKPPPGRKYPQTNGWTFWKYRGTKTGELLSIDILRKKISK